MDVTFYMKKPLHIIGGGMAGSEAAWQAATMGVQVKLYEMRPKIKTFAHQTGCMAEMVCSNSFRSEDHQQNAVGLLHWELQQADGLIIQKAYENRLPAGGALAVDRDAFAQAVTKAIKAHPNIEIVDGRHRFCFGAVQSRLYSTADMGKRAAREKAKNEVRLRNIRYREASSAARGGEKTKVDKG